MQVKAQDLARRLASGLAPVYLISSDETLLVEEACDQIVAAARAQGFNERSVHHVEGSFKWHSLAQDAASLSLFADRKVLDVRIPGAKFDKEGAEFLKQWAAEVPEETLLLLRTSRLQPRQRNAAWFKALDQAGVICLIWPLGTRELPGWMRQRLQAQGLEIEQDALQMLCERTEGNLLAAAQEVDKLQLAGLPSPITLDALLDATEDAAHFSSFDLIDAVLAGERARVATIIRHLRDDGVAVFAVLGAFTSQLRRLSVKQGVPPQRQRLAEQFLRRVKNVDAVLSECALIDQQGKGQLHGDAWVSFSHLLMRLAGARSLPLPSRDARWQRRVL